VTATVKVAVFPATTVWLRGCVVIEGIRSRFPRLLSADSGAGCMPSAKVRIRIAERPCASLVLQLEFITLGWCADQRQWDYWHEV